MAQAKVVAKKRKSSAEALSKKLGDKVTKKFGEESVPHIDDASSNIKEWFTTSIPPLDVILSGKVGKGFPSNRLCEIFGVESIGKTSLGGTLIREIQRIGGIGVFIDSEATFDRERCRGLGVDPNTLVYVDVETLEDTLDATLEIIEGAKDNKVLIFWDTLAATMAKGEEGRRIGESALGIHARVLSQAMRRLTKRLAHSRTAFIVCNQRKEGGIGVAFATERDKNQTLGGAAIRFHAQIRLFLRFSKKLVHTVKGKKEHIGFESTAKLIKNKGGVTDITARLVFIERNGGRYDPGLSCLRTLQQWKAISGGNTAIKFNEKQYSFLGWKQEYDKNAKLRATVHALLEKTFAEQTAKDEEDIGEDD